jgi:hypothetical protein
MRNLVLSLILMFIGSVATNAQSNDKLSQLRTDKKIVTVDKATAPYYAIQILALTQPPQEPGYFKNIDAAREFVCADGYVRYVVGSYNSFKEAAADLSKYIDLGYKGAFVVNTSKLGAQSSGFGNTVLKIDPAKTYLIQLSAFRFPVYLTYFEKIDNVLEFYMKDKIYRYTTDKISGTSVESELKRIKGLGYNGAFIVEFDKYQSFQIE